MQLVQVQALQQIARLAICTGLGGELLNALGEGGALIGLGRLKHLLQHPYALGPRGMLHSHDS